METINVIYLNSATATNKNLNKSTANFVLSPPIIFPQNCKLKVACQQFSYTNFFLNVSAALANNHFVVEFGTGPVVHTITIPDGSYNVSELSSAVNVGVLNAGLPDGLVTLIPDFATNKVLFNISLTNYRLSFPAGTMYVLLGTTLAQFIPAEVIPGTPVYTTGIYSELAPAVANFNSILTVYLHTSLSNNSVFSGNQSNILASIIPTVPIGSVQEFSPYNMVHVDAHELVGANLSSINIYLTDQSNNPIALQDDFSTTILVSRVIEPVIQVNSGNYANSSVSTSLASIKRPEPF